MAKNGFSSVVAARTRAALQILETPELLARFEELGGLKRDLEAIVQAGVDAEASNLGQSQSNTLGKATTVEVLSVFAALQKEYSAVMGIVQAVRGDLARSSGSAELITDVDGILTNETMLTLQVYEDNGAPKKSRMRKSKSQEALRAEIAN